MGRIIVCVFFSFLFLFSLKLSSGEVLPADAIVTATGLRMKVLCGVEVIVDKNKIDLSESYTYKGMMFSKIPNLIQTFGYINASWTLRADLTSELLVDLLTTWSLSVQTL